MSENCNTDIKIHYLRAKSQMERHLQALDPASAPIDSREMIDLVNFTSKLASGILFYNKDNIHSGDWNSFFSTDITALLSQIISIDILGLQKVLFNTKKELTFQPQDDYLHPDIIAPFSEKLSSLVVDVNRWINDVPADFYLNEYFKDRKSKLNDAKQQYLDLISAPAQGYVSLFQGSQMGTCTSIIFELLQDLSTKSRDALLSTLENYPRHSPHYALFLAFLKLHKRAQSELNNFTAKHLKFYFEDYLGFKKVGAVPDHVHLIMEAYPDTDIFMMDQNTIFEAGKNPDGKMRYYKSEGKLNVSNSHVTKLRSLCKTDSGIKSGVWDEQNGAGTDFDIFDNKDRPELGIAIAHTIFLMHSGNRKILLDFLNKSKFRSADFDFDDLTFYISAANGWEEIEGNLNNYNVIEFNIGAEKDAIVGFDSEVHKGFEFNTTLPILKIITKSGGSDIDTRGLHITIEVADSKSFKLYGPNGEVDINKKFYPFGEMPKEGDSLFFTSNEFFQKDGAQAILPMENMMKSFFIRKCLQNGSWLGTNDDLGYFLNNYPIGPTNDEDSNIETNSKNGFLRYSFHDFNDNKPFLQKYYNAIKEGKDLPSAPTLSDLTFSYYCQTSIDAKSEFPVYKLMPFGYQISTNYTANDFFKGEIYIGIENVKKEELQSILCAVKEGSSNLLKDMEVLSIAYLKNNHWRALEAYTDDSQNLNQSGIISFKTPDDDSIYRHTVLNDGLFWLRIGVSNNLDAICQIKGFHSQSLKAVLFDENKEGLYFMENIAPDTVKGIYYGNSKIKKVNQPYPSFGGNRAQNAKEFHTSTSEFLRHKNRASASWDYETLILSNFSEVEQVKCLNHYEYEAEIESNLSAGHVTLIPIARLEAHGDQSLPFLRKDLLYKIGELLRTRTSPHVKIHIKNPKLEFLSFDFKIVKSDNTVDDNVLVEMINQEIKEYISPWMTNSKFRFSSAIRSSEIVRLLDSIDYVDYIYDLKIWHQKNALSTTRGTLVEEIKPSSPYSFFMARDHHIIFQSSNICSHE